MIRSKEDYLYYLEADRVAKSIPSQRGFFSRLKSFLYPNVWEFQCLLRKYEYYSNCKTSFFSKVYRKYIALRFKNLSVKLGFSIPINVFGPGLSIAHTGTIIVSGGSKIGANCRLHSCVNIGTEAGYGDRAPIIGDNCYIGPGAKIFGKIELGTGMVIGANAVVNKSVDGSNLLLLGIPARIIKEVNPYDYLIPATVLVDKGLNETDEYLGVPARELNKILNNKFSKNNK